MRCRVLDAYDVQMSVDGRDDRRLSIGDVVTFTWTDVDPAARYLAILGVQSDGRIACWGEDFFGQAEPPWGPFISVSDGAFHT